MRRETSFQLRRSPPRAATAVEPRRLPSLAAQLAAAVVLSACGGDATRAASPSVPVAPSKAAEASLPGPPGLSAVPLGSFQSELPEVAFARGGTGGLFVFVHAARLWARAVRDGSDEPGEAVDIGPVGALGTELSLLPDRDGFALLVDERIDQNHHLKVHKLDASGKPRGAALALSPVAEPVGWAGLVLLEQGALVLHSVEHEGRSSLAATPLDRDLGRKAGPTTRLLEGVAGWSATSTPEALFVGAVRTSSGGDPRSGFVEVLRVDASAKAGSTVRLTEQASAEMDVEVAAIAGGVIAAWTDLSGAEPAVRIAVVDLAGKPRVAPKYVAPPVGDQALIALRSAPNGKGKAATIAWENVGQVHEGSRVLRLATVDADGAVSAGQTILAIEASATPDVVADGEGVAALTLARAVDSAGYEGDVWPSYVRLAQDLSVRSAEPIRFAGAGSPHGVADSVWNLSCDGGRCSALAAHRDGTTIVHAVDLPVRTSTWSAPAWRADQVLPPSIASMRVVLEGERLVATSASQLPDGEGQALVAWLSYHLEGTTPSESPPRGEPPYAATLALQTVNDDGEASAPIVVSRRALSSGGVSTASTTAGGKSELVIAWVASDRGTPQAFVTKVDGAGKKLAQKKLTLVERKTKKPAATAAREDAPSSAVSGITIAHAPLLPDARRADASTGEGFVVAWIDHRDGNGELYAARVNRSLDKTVVDKRITHAAGNAADPSIAVRGGEAFIAFSDARDGKPSDIYLAHVDTATLREIDDDARVYASRGTSRSPSLQIVGSSLLLAWIEEPPGEEQGPSVLKIGLVDDVGRLVGAPRTLGAPDRASVTSFAIRCAKPSLDSCRGVLGYTSGGAPSLGGFTLGSDASPSAVRKLGALSSAPFADASPSFADASATSLFFVDEAGPDRGRLRRMSLAW